MHKSIYDVNVKFLTQIKASYLADNSMVSCKNIQCFPDCNNVHKEIGFCGSLIVIAVSFNR